jgi:hypothetical protein
VESDTEYFRRRASDERTAALQARDARARDAHLEMADRYEDLVRGIASHDQAAGLQFAASPQPTSGSWRPTPGK